MAINIRKLKVTDTKILGSNMKRITLHGDDLSDFPENQESGYVKLRFPRVSEDIGKNTKKPFDLRSYTIRSFDPERLELVLDFLLHGDSGPASKWASSVERGDSIEIAGPGPAILASPDADWYLFTGDMTALPAIAVNLEKLSPESQGLALLEINSLEDKQELIKPQGVEVKWIINPEPLNGCSDLINALSEVEWKGNNPYAWIAGEFELMRFARQLIKHEKSLPKDSMYLSCYWKIGADDPGMKRAKAALILLDSLKNIFKF
jgi:NADPH-dependent ferric siderophore reductase